MRMNNSDEKLTMQIYQKLFRENGMSYKTLNWGSIESQKLRFKVLAEIADLTGKKILDVGCGLGDFAEWFSSNNINVDYYGLDLTPELVNHAKVKYPNLNFVNGSIFSKNINFLPTFDFVFASGIFYTYTSDGEMLMKEAISNMWKLCKQGIAFNSLSIWSHSIDQDEFYANPVEILEYCRTLTPWIKMRHDYHHKDFTVYLYRFHQK